jgi:hypothetical protein
LRFYLNGGTIGRGPTASRLIPAETLKHNYDRINLLPSIVYIGPNSPPNMAFFSDDAYGHGLSSGAYRGYQHFGHDGGTLGHISHMIMFPDVDQGSYVAINSFKGQEPMVEQWIQSVVFDLFNGFPPMVDLAFVCGLVDPRPTKPAPNQLARSPVAHSEQYNGTFHNTANGVAVIINDPASSTLNFSLGDCKGYLHIFNITTETFQWIQTGDALHILGDSTDGSATPFPLSFVRAPAPNQTTILGFWMAIEENGPAHFYTRVTDTPVTPVTPVKPEEEQGKSFKGLIIGLSITSAFLIVVLVYCWRRKSLSEQHGDESEFALMNDPHHS